MKLGSHHTEETKRKMRKDRADVSRERNSFYGKYHSEETRRKMRIKRKGRKPNLGHKHSKEARQKMSKSQQGRKHSEETKRKISEVRKGKPHPHSGHKATEETKRKMRESIIKHYLSGKHIYKNTSIERKIEKELQRRGIYYEKQVPLCKVTIADFYLPQSRTVVYCDGEYWHSKEGRKDKDINQDVILTFNGFNVYRFTEREINKSAKRCLNKI
jgi:very-short-patch-repair endonuclease